MKGAGADLVVPVMELLGTRLTAEVPGDPPQRACDAPLTQLAAVVTGHTLQPQTLGELLLEQQLAAWVGKEDMGGSQTPLLLGI